MVAPAIATGVAAGGRRAAWAHRIAMLGFAAAGPLAVMASKALWTAGVVVALARIVGWLDVDRRAAAGAWFRDLGRLQLLWPLALLALASAVWALDPARSLERGLRLFLEFAVGATMLGLAVEAGPDAARRLVGAAAVGLIAGAAIGTADIWLSGGIMFWAHDAPPTAFAYGRSAAFVALATLPVGILCWLHGRAALGLAAVAAGLLFVLNTFNETAQLAMIPAALAAALALWRWTRPLPVLAFAVVLLAMPAVLPVRMDGAIGCTLMEAKLSLVHRLGIWNYADTLIAEKPLLGWGLEAARDVPGGTDRYAMPACANVTDSAESLAQRMPLHPHDFALNLWLELGAVGAFLGLCVVAGWTRALARLPARRAMGFAATAGGAFLPATISFGMWQGWWITSLFLVAALCCLAPQATPASAGGPPAAR
ncbi:MAG: O-antigen ligase family protein [Alphaproteobacteria bacterium]